MSFDFLKFLEEAKANDTTEHVIANQETWNIKKSARRGSSFDFIRNLSDNAVEALKELEAKKDFFRCEKEKWESKKYSETKKQIKFVNETDGVCTKSKINAKSVNLARQKNEINHINSILESINVWIGFLKNEA